MLYSTEKVREKEKNIYKAIVIMGKEAEWLSSLGRTTVEHPVYKAIEHYVDGKVRYEVIEKED